MGLEDGNDSVEHLDGPPMLSQRVVSAPQPVARHDLQANVAGRIRDDERAEPTCKLVCSHVRYSEADQEVVIEQQRRKQQREVRDRVAEGRVR